MTQKSFGNYNLVCKSNPVKSTDSVLFDPKKENIKSYEEINAKIKAGEAVVATAEEMVDIVKENGPDHSAKKVDMVTTGTSAQMCFSGMFLNFGQMVPNIKAAKVWLNKVNAYAGLAAVDA